jgi:LmbE family N-acetylglucosaminyl deacetylase
LTIQSYQSALVVFFMKPPALLLIFAHPDDHLLVAGTLFHYRAQGYVIHEIVCTDGENGSIGEVKRGHMESRNIRLQEHTRAVSLLDISSVRYLNQRDGFVHYDDEVVSQVVQCIRALTPQIVITHTRVDMHPDHEAVAAMARHAVKLAHLSVDLGADEHRWRVPWLWFVPCYLAANLQILVDTTAFQEHKKAIVQAYPSQHNPKLVKSMTVIDERNALVLPHVTHAEGFEIDPSWPMQL